MVLSVLSPMSAHQRQHAGHQLRVQRRGHLIEQRDIRLQASARAIATR
jgi:hypothetical protein